MVLRLGRPWASRVMATWLAGLGPEVTQIAVDPYGRWNDPDRVARWVLRCDPAALASAVASAAPGGVAVGWADAWAGAEAAAQAAFDRVLAGHDEVTEPGVARALGDCLPAGTTLVTSSSMPVRDVEWYLRPRTGLRVLANRGANGIDGVISTALGVAAVGSGSDRRAARRPGLPLRRRAAGARWPRRRPARRRRRPVLHVGRDRQRRRRHLLVPAAGHRASEDRFEHLWGTPHGVDLAAIAAAYGVAVDDRGPERRPRCRGRRRRVGRRAADGPGHHRPQVQRGGPRRAHRGRRRGGRRPSCPAFGRLGR